MLDRIENSDQLRAKLWENTDYFRERLQAAGFELAGRDHPIIPVMVGDATLATEMATRLLARGIYVIGFSYPVVPKGQARIRTQMSAALTRDQLDVAIAAFVDVGRELEIIS